MASKVAVAWVLPLWVLPLEVLPLTNEDVPRTVPPELKVTVPVAGEPIPEALTVAASNKDCAVCCDVSTVVVARCVIEKLMGVKLTLELRSN